MRRWTAGAVLLAALTILFGGGFSDAAQYSRGQAGYLKSATYYSDDWVVNFWNSESARMEEELARIAGDGFNNIILVVPWREFQPELSPCTYGAYAWEKLDRVMSAAAGQGLSVMLRVGYTWDYAGEESVLKRYQQLLTDRQTRLAWRAYAERLYMRASAHENFCGGFLCWEDFWNFTDTAAALGSGERSRQLAQSSGYASYLKTHYSLEEIGTYYGREFASYEEIYFPSGSSPARRLFYEFYDSFLNELLAESQEVFPNLSMEVRLDRDAVDTPAGGQEGYLHAATFPCGSSTYTSAMYSVAMWPRKGEYQRIFAAEALTAPEEQLQTVFSCNGGKPLYLDQFLFTDNTRGFEKNTQLREEEKSSYLIGMVPILKRSTMGYGIWTYRNYGDNKLFNSQFGLGEQGWRFWGGSRVEEREGNNRAVLPAGAGISQSIRNRITGTEGRRIFIRFRLSGEGSSRAVVKAMGTVRTIAAARQEQLVELELPRSSESEFSVTCGGTGEIQLDDLSVYTYESEGDLYRMDGSEDFCIQALRQMNQSL